MQKNLTRGMVVIVMTAGAVYHLGVLFLLATVLA